jgi:uncharacterized protein (TIGR02996 family)
VTHQEAALIEAIRAEPEDDLARMVYADWLDENGHAERAELIRVQLALQEDGADRERVAREQKILSQHRAEWLGPLIHEDLQFRRGMVVACWTSLLSFEAGSARLAEANDPIWVVERRLYLSSRRFSDEQVRALVRTPAYSRLTRFHLAAREGVTAAAAQAVASSPGSANLFDLWLCEANLGLEGIRALTTSPHLRRLRRLNLRASGLDAESGRPLGVLAETTNLPGLVSLNLCDNKIGDARLRRLLKAPWVGQLAELLLPGNAIRDAGAKALAGCAALSGLRLLNLNGNQIGDVGAVALLNSPHLRGLRELSLGYNSKIAEPVRDEIARRFGGVGETGRSRHDSPWRE